MMFWLDADRTGLSYSPPGNVALPPTPFTAQPLERRVLLASVPDGFTDLIVAGNVDSPTAMDVAPDGRIFVAGQKGHLYIISGNQTLNPLTIPNVDSQDERGFGGIKLDPNFNTNGFVYVYYTRINGTTQTGRNNRIARYTFNGNSLVGGETVVLDLPDILGSIFHMGGALHFGPDGKLYVGVGDHLQFQAAQQLDNIFGKILRINKDGSIPTDNPFFNQTTGINRAIWARGLRNPFTFNFQPGTGLMLINDVGQSNFEEINRGQVGANYGWPNSEGPTSMPGITGPVYSYATGSDGTCAITGAQFYNPQTQNFPSQYVGKYLFSDLCGGFIKTLDTQTFQAANFATGLSFPVDLDLAPDGSLLYLQRGTGVAEGSLGRIRFGQAGAPAITQHPQSQTATPGTSVSFTVQATGTGTLAYQWQRNTQNISGATAATLTLQNVQDADEGSYRVIVSNSIGSITSNTATLTVQSGSAPQAFIDTPLPGTLFRAGQTISYSGRGLDPDDGTLGPSRFTWQVDYHTGNVVRPFVPETTGSREGSFTIPSQTPYTAADVFYRIRLTVRDSEGLSATVTRDIQPITSTITLASNIAGATLEIDAQPKSLPFRTEGVAGFHRLLGAPLEQTINGTRYIFDGWSDGGEANHRIATPHADFTNVARYRVAPKDTTRGLGMTIYNNRDRTGTMVTRNIDTIEFDWGTGSPDPLIHPDTFFIRFRGYVQPQFTETYTFFTRADDGVRLFVNGQLLVDAWHDSNGAELSGSIALQTGQKYDLRYDYFENTGTARAHLEWSSPSTPKSVVPKSRLLSRILPQTLFATADAMVLGSNPTSNFGARGTLQSRLAGSESSQRESFLKFDISELNIDTMGSARLRLFGRLSANENINVTTGLFDASGVSWGESSINWNNRPRLRTDRAITTVLVTDNHNQFWEFDITSFLRQEKQAGRQIVTFALRNLNASQVYSLFYSRENSINAPQIVVAV